jgi:outer membrane receptor protein involved in Fe transport
MSTRNSIRRAVRYALLTSATLVAASAMPAQAADDTISEVVVTGSRIQRPDFESASPIVSVGQDSFENVATLSVETLLNSLPQFVPSVTNTSNNPSNGGQANVELRGLGTQRTLVLLDGRRVVPSNGTGVVDLNLLPPSLIGNVEIITGGASAVYGSDAVAGVVNFKTKDIEGIEFQTNFSQTSESDGDEMQFSVTAGTKFADGRGKIIGNISYSDREEVLAARRNFSRVALGFDPVLGTFAPVGSGAIEEGVTTIAASQAAVNQVFGAYGVAPGAVTSRGFGFNDDGTLFSTGSGMPGSVQNFRGEITDTFNDAQFTYNFSPTNYLQLPLERTSFFTRASFDVSEQAQVYFQGIGARYEADTQLAPTPGTQLFVPVSNPFVTPDIRALAMSRGFALTDPDEIAAARIANLSVNKRLTELGPRFENNEFTTYQALAGVKGDIGSNWSYDVYGSYGRVELDNTQLGSISRSAVEQLTFAADGGQAACGGFNPFGLGSISPACADFVTVDALNKTTVEQTIAELVLTGAVATLPAGELRTAFGAFYKKDEFAFIADDKLRASTPAIAAIPGVRDGTSAGRVDVAGFNASDNTVGDTDSNEFYVEALVPILSDMPGAKRLEANFGYRFADYSTVGSVDSYKTELTYQPITSVTFRGSYQRAVRAPNISELFQPQVTNFPAINPPDPCATNSPQRLGANGAQVRTLCAAQGLGPGLIDQFTFPNGQVQGLAGGNPNLGEETSDSFTYGVVYRPDSDNRFLSAFQVSLDYYKIEIEDAIAPITALNFVDRCYNPAFNPTFDPGNAFCGFFSRDPGTGEIVNASETAQNIGAIETAGVDVQIDWAADVGDGRLGVNLLGSWLDKFDQQDLPGDPFTPLVDTIGGALGGAFPRWKATLNTNYAFPFGLGLNARLRYIDNITDVAITDFEIGSIAYLDLTASYDFKEGPMKGLGLRLGVLNAGDRDPKIFPTSIQSNTDPSTYDVLGRRVFASAKFTF